MSTPPFPAGPILRAAHELEDSRSRSEEARRVAGARVVFAEYALLQHDFPRLRDESLCDAHPELRGADAGRRAEAVQGIIDRWLLDNAAFVSERQAGQQRVNTSIDTVEERALAHRPPRYGRALVLPVRGTPEVPDDGHGGLLDVKGAGVAPHVVPSWDGHASGLCDLGEALRDLAFQWIIDAIFRHAGTQFRGVPVYAVLDLGFDVRCPPGGTVPAGMQVRRAHRRPPRGFELPIAGSPEELVKFEIEMLLRSYGVSSCNDGTCLTLRAGARGVEITYGGNPVGGLGARELGSLRRLARLGSRPATFDGVNVQLTREVGAHPSRAQVVDFGHYAARADFEAPVLSLVRGRPLRWGDAIWPDSPHFVRPDPRLSIHERWGPAPEPDPTAPLLYHWPPQERPALLAYELAARFRAGALGGADVRARLRALVDATVASWPSG